MKKLFTFCFAIFGVLAMAAFGQDAHDVLVMASGGVVVSTNQFRAQYERFVSYLEKSGLIALGASPIITQTDLRLEAELTSSKSSYPLNIKEGTGTVRQTENRLNTNDVFMAVGISIGVLKESDAGVVNEIYTYPDKNYFGAAGEATALEAIYHGKTNLTTDSLQRLNGLLNHHMRYVPGVQYDDTDNVTPAYGPMLEERGYFLHNPNVILDGSKTNILEVVLGPGNYSAIAGAAGNKNILVVCIHGFKFSGQVSTTECGV